MDAIGASPTFSLRFLGPRATLRSRCFLRCLKRLTGAEEKSLWMTVEVETQMRTGNGYNDDGHGVRGLLGFWNPHEQRIVS
jgi:hypothetical protein